MPSAIDYTGQRFGKLIALKPSGSKDHRAVVWVFECDCGGIVTRVPTRLKRAQVRGFISACSVCRGRYTNHQERLRARARHSYRQGACTRKVDFRLSDVEVNHLFAQSCFYCGALPDNRMTTQYSNDVFVYSGIDRLNNSLGYTIDNCVSCCKICNFAKRDMSSAEFTDWIMQAADHLRS